MGHRPRILLLSGLGVLSALGLWAQAPPPKAPAAPAAPANPFLMSPEERARLDQLAREDHADTIRQLGITKLRPGANGFAAAGDPNAANYDPAKANPYPDWPEVLALQDGRKVTTAETWWQKRRPEIVEDFEREVYGRVPMDVPKVTWTVAETVNATVGGQPVVARRLIGHVDNSIHPAITVDIEMAVVVPVNAKGPVPVLMMFGWGNMPDDPLPRFPGFPEPAAPPSTDQLIAAGWGYVSLATSSIQADNGAGLTAGIIGLANQGKRRTPAQWGTLRAWAWGAARALDYLETLPAVDRRRVGIEGVSRYGKAALVTMAFEPRFAVVLVGSSGQGGAKPHRRNFGEAVENLTGSSAYHWMAGNFLRYGAACAPHARPSSATAFRRRATRTGWTSRAATWPRWRRARSFACSEWRLSNGELDGVNPKVIVLLAGTNNVGREPGDEAKVKDVTRGLQAIVETCRKKAPAATIVLVAIFPRNDNPAVMPTLARINANLAKMADGKVIRFLDVNAKLADPSGRLFEGMMPDGLHPSLEGYEVWAQGLRSILTERLGPPAATDHAPPPTGDPSAGERSSP